MSISKEKFVEYLKKIGYSTAKMSDGIPTVTVVGDKRDYIRTRKDITLAAKKIGYSHSYRVVLLEEVVPLEVETEEETNE